MSQELSANVVRTRRIEDTSASGRVNLMEIAWVTRGVPPTTPNRIPEVNAGEGDREAHVQFMVSEDVGPWDRKHFALGPAMDMSTWVGSDRGNRLTTLGGAFDTTSKRPPDHVREYSQRMTRPSVNIPQGYEASGRQEVPLFPTLAGQLWLAHCYVTMPPRSQVKTDFNGWELRYDNGGTWEVSDVRHVDPASNETVSLCVSRVFLTTATSTVPRTWTLWYTADGTQVTDARDGCLDHRISIIQLSKSRDE